MTSSRDHYFMQEALKEARKAYTLHEVPVGAIVVKNEQIIARAHNQVEHARVATAHAELIALSLAFKHTGDKYLPACTLYVTLEPCCMCAGALYWAQMGRLVFGAQDLERGYRTVEKSLLHPRTQVTYGVLAQQSSMLLKQFFHQLRAT